MNKYILKSKMRHPLYNYFVRVGGVQASRRMGCRRQGGNCVRCRWAGNSVIRGTKAEAAAFCSREQALENLPDDSWTVVAEDVRARTYKGTGKSK